MNKDFHRFNKPISTMKNMKDLKKYIETEKISSHEEKCYKRRFPCANQFVIDKLISS
jgi:hypothetical protein